ncbi:hypothetical protein DPMN_042391 [Dreissena polymorpha]|uniref:Uncharacterized protein n=1 Tax=Dreissena polymorpha TaxID=45954 RepID=A0A9D4HX04_DREPO|nr:hypothetical protein DPMN_042391 [Dreissena polymorpha]
MNPRRPYGNTGAQQQVFGINSVWSRKTVVADTLLRRKSLNRQEPQIGSKEGEESRNLTQRFLGKRFCNFPGKKEFNFLRGIELEHRCEYNYVFLVHKTLTSKPLKRKYRISRCATQGWIHVRSGRRVMDT